MKKILILCGHPSKESLNYSIAKSYFEGAKKHHDVRFIQLRDLDFNYNLEHGYNKRTELEPDLLKAQKDILWADHIVWIHPVWWGSYPAVMKAFIDRVLLPGFAFKYRNNSAWWDKLLKGKTCRIITTLHTPSWYYKLFNSSPSINSLKKTTMEFCGVKKVKTTILSATHKTAHLPKDSWIQKAYDLGFKGK